jgi:DNA-binding CsgD family transcriptional regulator
MDVATPRVSREQRAPNRFRQVIDQALSGRADWARAALDQLDQGIILLDGLRLVHFANRTARAICAESDGLRLNGCALIATAAAEDRSLLRAAQCAVIRGQSTSLRLSRPSLRRPLSLLVAPLNSPRGRAGPVALLMIADPDRHTAPPMDRLIQVFGLTVAEAQVARQLMQGLDIAGTAARLGIGSRTLRAHLRRVLAKTGTHRRSELIRLLLQEARGMLGQFDDLLHRGGYGAPKSMEGSMNKTKPDSKHPLHSFG